MAFKVFGDPSPIKSEREVYLRLRGTCYHGNKRKDRLPPQQWLPWCVGWICATLVGLHTRLCWANMCSELKSVWVNCQRLCSGSRVTTFPPSSEGRDYFFLYKSTQIAKAYTKRTAPFQEGSFFNWCQVTVSNGSWARSRGCFVSLSVFNLHHQEK